jgi:N-acetylglucosamine malate deacetylase 1
MFSLSRRKLLAAAAAAAPTRAQTPADRPLKIVVAGGHPGDPEYGCGGTAARYADLGHLVTLLYLNSGQKNCPDKEGDPGRTVRTAEAQKACAILKTHPKFAGQCDGHSVVDDAHYKEFHELLDGLTPDILFTQWPLDGHRDHRATFMLTYDYWLRTKKRFALFLYEVSNGEDTFQFSPTRYVDISRTEPRKRAACYAHASQAPDRFYALQSQVAQFRGIESGYHQAEAFIEHVGGPTVRLP